MREYAEREYEGEDHKLPVDNNLLRYLLIIEVTLFVSYRRAILYYVVNRSHAEIFRLISRLTR